MIVTGALAACGSGTPAIPDGGGAADLAASLDATVTTDGPPPDLAGNMSGKAQPAHQAQKRYFPDTAPWYRDVSKAPVAPDSAAITAWMVQRAAPGGWGGGGRMRVDFSIVAVEVPPGTPKRAHQPVQGYHYTPDCDTAPVPVVPGGAVEETYGTPTRFTAPFSGYDCASFSAGGDCHMLLVARAENRLYEIYHATIDAQNAFRAGCLAVWDTTSTDPNLRGQQCTSADAAGFPIAALLFTPEEIAAGKIDHAIRFILPNSMIRTRKYVAPATHGTNTTGPLTSGPYGFRMRLRADYPLNTLSPSAQVVARALQKYGMLLSDGGNIALTAQSDVLSSVKWADVGFDANSLSALKATDFDVIDYGTPIDVTYDCKRTVIAN